MSLLTVPIQPKSLSDLKTRIKRAEPHADIIEIWMDHLGKEAKRVAPEAIRALTRKKLCIANKGKEEKGKWTGSERERVELLARYAESGCEYVDIGIHTRANLIMDLIQRKAGAQVIGSYHNFKETPSDKELWRIVEKMKRLGVDIVKLAAKAQKKEDVLTMLEILLRAKKEGVKIIGLSMDINSKIGRVAADEFGSYMSYVALDENSRSAPGQLTISQYRRIKEILKK